MSPSHQPVEVFLSYAWEDEQLCQQFLKHLNLLQRQGLITAWHDRQISPGSDKKLIINNRLSTASLILLLISVDFLNSDYCDDIEMEHILQRHNDEDAMVVPILLRPVDWSETRFADLQQLPRERCITSHSNQDEAFTLVAKELRSLIKDLSQQRETLSFDKKRRDCVYQLAYIIRNLQVEEAIVKECYRNTRPVDSLGLNEWSYPNDESSNKRLWKAVLKLNDAWVPENEIPPIVKFVEQLALYPTLHTKNQEELHQWVNKFASLSDIPSQEIANLRTTLREHYTQEKQWQQCSTGATSLPPALLIKLRCKIGKTFSVQAWLRYGEKGIQRLPLRVDREYDEVTYNRRTISKFLHQLLEDVQDFDQIEPEAKTKLWIEFFLPYELFDEEVDRWTTDGLIYLGTRYRVVIRPLEREKQDKAHWLTKGNKLHDSAHVKEMDVVHWIGRSLSDHNTKMAQQSIIAELLESHVLCCCMKFTPSDIIGQSNKKSLFRALVKSGTPVALWPRKLLGTDQEIIEMQALIEEMLDKHKLSQLPEAVRQLRKDAMKVSDPLHVGRHLTLMWDDPTKLPPEEPKLQETKRGR